MDLHTKFSGAPPLYTFIGLEDSMEEALQVLLLYGDIFCFPSLPICFVDTRGME